MKERTSWHSDRLGEEISVVRWGIMGVPLLLFPTAGGDAEEVERFKMIDTLAPYLEQGRVKIYSCDNLGGRTMLVGEGTVADRMRAMNVFQQFVYHELVPAIRTDCNSPDIEVMTAGASIGAFYALAMVCRYPDVFSRAICMSGTYDLLRFLKAEPAEATEDFYLSSPVHHLHGLDGKHLEVLRTRFVVIASGRGRAEDIDESWRVAHLLGRKGVPNRMDDWGPEWHHDWPTWRNMIHRYVDELVPAPEAPAEAGNEERAGD